MSWSGSDWGNFLLSPGVMQGGQYAQGLMGMLGGGGEQDQGFGNEGGSNMNLAQLLEMMNRNQGGGGQQGGGSYIGGQGLI